MWGFFKFGQGQGQGQGQSVGSIASGVTQNGYCIVCAPDLPCRVVLGEGLLALTGH